MALPRREFLLSCAVLSSGCTALAPEPTPTDRPDRDDDGVPDGPDDYPADPDLAFRSSSAAGTLTVDPGDFSAYRLQGSDADGENHLRYEAATVSDETVDVAVFGREAYDAYENGARDVSIVDRYTRTGVGDVSVSAPLNDRALILAVDNTDLLTPATADPVDVAFRLEIAEPADSGSNGGSTET